MALMIYDVDFHSSFCPINYSKEKKTSKQTENINKKCIRIAINWIAC